MATTTGTARRMAARSRMGRARLTGARRTLHTGRAGLTCYKREAIIIIVPREAPGRLFLFSAVLKRREVL